MNWIFRKAEEFLKRSKWVKSWKKAVTVLGVITVFITTYALILPAITVEKNKTDEVGMVLDEETTSAEVFNATEEEPDTGTDAEVPEDTSAQEASAQDLQADGGQSAENLGFSDGSSEDFSAGGDTEEVVEKQAEKATSPLVYDCEYYTVWLSFGDSENIPAGTVLTVQTPENVQQYRDTITAQLGENGINTITTAEFYQFLLNGADGSSVVPAGNVDIRISYKQNTVQHVDDQIRVAVSDSNGTFEYYEKNADESDMVTLTDGIITELSIKNYNFTSYNGVIGLTAGKNTEEEPEETVGAEESVVAEEPAATEEPVETEETAETEESVSTEEPVSTEEIVVVEEPSEGTAEEPVEGTVEEEPEETEVLEAETMEEDEEAIVFEGAEATLENENEQDDEETELFAAEAEEAESTENLNVLTYTGADYQVTLSYGSDAGIPENAELYAEEISQVSGKFQEYYQKALTEVGGDVLSFARFFDVKILVDGEVIEPEAAVDVSIGYADSVDIPVGQRKAVHFTDDGQVEVINVDENGTAQTETTAETMAKSISLDLSDQNTFDFVQSSFSVTGTIVADSALTSGWPTQNTDYILVLENGGKYYAIKGANSYSGISATEVQYNSADNTVYLGSAGTSSVNEYYWNYLYEDNKHVLKYKNANVYIDPNGDHGTWSSADRTLNLNGKKIYSTLSGTSRYLGISNGNMIGNCTENQRANVYFATVSTVTPITATVVFNANGGTGTPPNQFTIDEGEDFTFPESGDLVNDGYVFVGWSANANAISNDGFTTPVYEAGKTGSVTEDTTFYAIWARQNGNTCFYIRLDGTVPNEPQAYEASDYTKGVTINNALKIVKFYANTLGVDDNLNSKPTNAQIISMLNDSSGTLGVTFKEDSENNIIVEAITNSANNESHYNLKVGEVVYVLWYVTKPGIDGNLLKDNSGTGWHVDGTLLVKERILLSYDANAPAGTFSDVPRGSQWFKDEEVVVGNDGGNNTVVKEPVRNDGYLFAGWEMYTKDANGDYTVSKGSYDTYDKFNIQEDTLLVAQWVKDTTALIVNKVNGNNAKIDTATFELVDVTDTSASPITKNTTQGTANFGTINLNTRYKLTETKAPDNYILNSIPIYFEEVQNDTTYSVYFYDSADATTPLATVPEGVTLNLVGKNIILTISNERVTYPVKFKKVDDLGTALSDISFKLYKGEGSWTLDEETGEYTYNEANLVQNLISGSDGFFAPTNELEAGEVYYLVEIRDTNNSKYDILNDPIRIDVDAENGISVSYNGISETEDLEGILQFTSANGTESATLTLINTLVLPVFKFYKIDAEGRPLAGAQFEFKDADGTTITGPEETTSGEDGFMFSVEPIDSAGTYILEEIAAPPGYLALENSVSFTVTRNGSQYDVTYSGIDSSKVERSTEDINGIICDVYTFKIQNTAGIVLPDTGGFGIIPYVLGGNMVIILATIICGYGMRRKGERRKNR